MASQPVDFISGLGALPDPQKALEDSLRFRAGLRASNAQSGLQEAQVAQAQSEQQRKSAYQGRLAQVLAKPTPEGYSALFAEYPEFKDSISKSWDTRDAAAKQSDLSQIGQVHAALMSKRPELAVKLMQSTIDARKAAGRDTSEDETILQAIKDGDPAATGLTGAQLAAIVGPEKYGQLYEQLNKGKQDFTLSAGGRRYDAEGNLIAEAPFAPQYRTVGEGQELVEVGGGGSAAPAPSGGALSVRTNNPGAIVNDPKNKWQGQVGTETVNGRTFAVFDTPANGARAHQKLIANQIKGGYDTPLKWAQHYAPSSDGNDPTAYASRVAAQLGIGINDTIPLSAVPRMAAASAAVESGGTPAAGGGVAQSTGGARVVARGAPKAKPETEAIDGATIEFYADKIAKGGDLPALGAGKSATAWRQAILKRAAEIQTGQGLTGGDSNLAQADVKANRSALLQAQKTYTNVVGFEDTFQRNLVQVEKLGPKGVGGSAPIFNKWIQAGRKSVQGDPAVSAFNVAVNTAANEYAKLASGGSGGGVTSDSARHEAMEILNNTQTWPQMQAAIKQMRIDGHNRVLAMEKQIGRLRGNISGAGGGATPTAPKPGVVKNGYRFKGGNPASPSSWVKL